MTYFKIPTIELIYNEYHKQTFYVQNGTYPKTIVNYEKVYKNTNLQELLKKFQSLLSRNREAIDWKLFIYALAQHFKTRFDLKFLSNLAGIKIYRNFIQSYYLSKDDEDDIYNAIINSLVFLNAYLRESDITFKLYLNLDRDTIPVALKHIYSGTISLYFYAAFEPAKVATTMLNFTEDLFQEYFYMSKEEFMLKYIMAKHKEILKYEKIKKLMDKVEKI